MPQTFSRRGFLAGLLGSASLPAFANSPTISLRPVPRPATIANQSGPAIKTLLDSSGVSGRVAIAVANAKTGAFLEGHYAEAGLPPASVTKALTALYALSFLGSQHRFNTKLIAAGKVQNGILKGDLVLSGGGDPTLDTNGLADLAKQLKAKGIREVSGRFKVWGGALPAIERIDKKQPVHAGYNPSVSGLSLNYNRVHFEWKKTASGYQVTMDARSDRYRPEIQVSRMKIINRDFPTYTYKEMNGVDHWTVAKSALGKGGARWLPVRQPEIYAGEVFSTLARSHGIKLKTPEKTQSAPKGIVLATFQSAPLKELLRGMLKYSTNLTAEMIGIAASQARGATIMGLKSSAKSMNAWAREKLEMSGAALVDHSGLGEASRMRADELVRVLARASEQAKLKPVLKEVYLRQQNGKINKSHPLTVRAKTGTLHFVSGLAGYIDARDGTSLAFVIFLADASLRQKLIGPNRERPKGARTWNRKAKTLQQRLLERWGDIYRS
ncbi:D-alanyl-D-alanine carboxypeptidase/D-alanyl-D-alanine-endopeptidase [Pseudopelagicola sp. nBUS_20]|uniref:D-alanyl-D-alanine carboxypeptidase/D-alanyl-D-alanine endopeptidase n=1 Tax=Pseudopelagicola sp. nBUS_20 TaxID=3395317 RepID=UPI003EB8BD70